MIFVVILLLFGAKKLPELARGIGKSMGEFKKAKDDFESELGLGESEAKKPTARSPTSEEEKKTDSATM